MSLVPTQLHLKNTQNETIDIFLRGGGEQEIESTGSLRVKCDNSLIMKGYDVFAQTNGGNFGIADSTLTNIYRLPNPNLQQPQQGQVIQFNSDGTSQFATVGGGGGGNFSTPSNQNLDMNIHTINNITDLNLVSPTDPGSIASLNVRDNQTTLGTNKPLQVSCAGHDMELVSNNIRIRANNGGIFGFFNDSGYFVLPQTVPTVDNSVMVFGSNGFSTFQQLPPNLSVDVATLQSQVASLITIINNLTNIQV